jgi:hypothetical protein
MKMKYLVAARNTEGRVCCWAQGEDLEACRKSVDERWATHGGSGAGCYPGEQRGKTDAYIVNEDASVVPYIAEPIPMPRAKPYENPKDRAEREAAEEKKFDELKDEGNLRRY